MKKHLVAILSCILLVLVYFQFTDENKIDDEAWEQIELNRSQNAYEKERREYLITIMFQQTGITLLLFFIPMMFVLYQNLRVQKKLKSKIAHFTSLSFIQATKPEHNPTSVQKLLEKHPELTANDLELCTLLKQNLTSKEIAYRFNITTASVYTARYRLRKKLHLPEDEDLTVYLTRFDD
jgi:DNA-binding CsgD family transcriptional regulator